MPSDAAYSISDLAGLSGLSVRTIRYYLAQGLIPASGESGPGAHYGDGHLARLRLVRRLQQQHLPLAEIRARLASLTDAEIASLAASEAPAVPAPETSALDYVRSVLVNPSAVSPAAMPAMRDTPPAAPSMLRRSALRRMAMPFLSEVSAPHASAEVPATAAEAPVGPAASTPPPSDPATIQRSQWERLSLGPNLELHVRRPLGRLEQKRVERLITIARQVLKEEQP